MAYSTIAGWIAKQLVKKTAKPVTQKSIDFSSNAIVKRLDNYNIKPDDIVSEDQLLKVLDSVKQAETNVFNNKFGNIIEQGMEGISKLKKAEGGRIGFKDGNGVADKSAQQKKFSERVIKLMDEEGFDFGEAVKEAMKEGYATGGRAGYYGGGQAMVGKDLSDIGHGSDALMARNMQVAPGGQATTSTGLNYLLGQDNDTVRVPYKEKGSVTLADLIKVNASGSKSGKKFADGGRTGFNEGSSVMSILKSKGGAGKGILGTELGYDGLMSLMNLLQNSGLFADGGRAGYNEGNKVLPKPKPKSILPENATAESGQAITRNNPVADLIEKYYLYQKSMPGVSQDTQIYLIEDFKNSLNNSGISQEDFMMRLSEDKEMR
jgi:hypothetical protein|tara:strand:- start:493 stop:1623 length:1131 start_codon:yes stop_codon:yes gene_type:complete